MPRHEMNDTPSSVADSAAKDAGKNEGAAGTTLLGRAVPYCDQYAPQLLYPITRADKRRELGLDPAALPFYGGDLWNAYELSWLDGRGKPQVATATFWVPAQSPCLIESKSLKLYLNSFNQSVFDDESSVAATLTRDLGAAAGAPVEVEISLLGDQRSCTRHNFAGTLLDALEVTCTHYTPAPELLQTASGGQVNETLVSHLLKSNCLVTGQPDWASISISYSGAPIDHAGLLRYLVSYRQHNEFHEQCVERIFRDIQQRCGPRQLTVYARYTRRGGLDINPWRSSEPGGGRPQNDGDVRQ